jgi:hypothetical protein
MTAARSAKLQWAAPHDEKQRSLLLPQEEPPGMEDQFYLWRLPEHPARRQGRTCSS